MAPRSAIQLAKTRPKAPVPPLSTWQPWWLRCHRATHVMRVYRGSIAGKILDRLGDRRYRYQKWGYDTTMILKLIQDQISYQKRSDVQKCCETYWNLGFARSWYLAHGRVLQKDQRINSLPVPRSASVLLDFSPLTWVVHQNTSTCRFQKSIAVFCDFFNQWLPKSEQSPIMLINLWSCYKVANKTWQVEITYKLLKVYSSKMFRSLEHL